MFPVGHHFLSTPNNQGSRALGSLRVARRAVAFFNSTIISPFYTLCNEDNVNSRTLPGELEAEFPSLHHEEQPTSNHDHEHLTRCYATTKPADLSTTLHRTLPDLTAIPKHNTANCEPRRDIAIVQRLAVQDAIAGNGLGHLLDRFISLSPLSQLRFILF